MNQTVVHMGVSGDTLPLSSSHYSTELLKTMTWLYRDIVSRMVLTTDQTLIVVEFPKSSIPVLHTSVASALAFHPEVEDMHLINVEVNDERAMILVIAAADQFTPGDFQAAIEQTTEACGGTLGERENDIHLSWARTREIETAIGYDESKDPNAKYGGYYGIDSYLADRIQEAGSYEVVSRFLETLRQIRLKEGLI